MSDIYSLLKIYEVNRFIFYKIRDIYFNEIYIIYRRPFLPHIFAGNMHFFFKFNHQNSWISSPIFFVETLEFPRLYFFNKKLFDFLVYLSVSFWVFRGLVIAGYYNSVKDFFLQVGSKDSVFLLAGGVGIGVNPNIWD